MWGRIDDKLHSHAKWLSTSLEARGLWSTLHSWSCDQLTDGKVPTALVQIHGGTRWKKLAAELVANGLWDVEGDGTGWRFHDFLDYNPSAQEVQAERERVSSARSEAGKKGAASRWNGGDTPNPPSKNDGKSDSKPDGKSNGKSIANAWQADGKPMAPTRPDPDPTRRGGEDTVTYVPRPTDDDKTGGSGGSSVVVDSPNGYGEGNALAPAIATSPAPPGPKGEGKAAFVERVLTEHPEWREPLRAKVASAQPRDDTAYSASVLANWLQGDGTPRPGGSGPSSSVGKGPVGAHYENDPEWKVCVGRHLSGVPRDKFPGLEERARKRLAENELAARKEGRLVVAATVDRVCEYMAKAHGYDLQRQHAAEDAIATVAPPVASVPSHSTSNDDG